MSLVVLFCGKISIDDRKRVICFNDVDCMRFRTKKQFDVAFEIVTKMIEHCKRYMYEIEEKRNKEGL
jgi:hypothetical protein